MQSALESDLAKLRNAGLLRALGRVTSRTGVEVVVDGRSVIDFSSNDYLGLASHPTVRDAALRALDDNALGAGAARLVSGNHELHELLERELARFKGAESALLFSSGYAANIGTIPALAGRRDVIYADELNHASLIDACRLSKAELRVIRHCDAGALRKALEADEGKFQRRLIVTDAVFSMDGDMYPLDSLVEIARRYGAWTYVDDAHGTGVLGENGRGAAEYWGVEGRIDVVMGTLGKALGVSGAFVAGSGTLVEYLMNRARSFVFTTGTPSHLAAACIAALRIVREEPERRIRLRRNSRRLRDGLRALGLESGGTADCHIVPLVLREADRTMRAGRRLLESGFLVGAIRPPTVPLGGARLRITVSAAHEDRHIDSLLTAVEEILAGSESRVSEPGRTGVEAAR